MKFLSSVMFLALAVTTVQVHAQSQPVTVLPALQPLPKTPVAHSGPIDQKTVTQAIARRLAAIAVDVCQANGYAVAATVVDRSGVPLAMVRSDNTGLLSRGGSERKAVSAASFKVETSALQARSQQSPNAANIVYIPGALLLGGGVPIRVNNEIIGAIGVGGAPDGRVDEQCAKYALDSLARQLGA